MTHRRIHIAHRGLAHSAEHRGTEHRFGSHRGIQFSAHFLLDNVADHIVGPQAHHRGWTTLFGNNVFALAILQNEQQISKTQVGDHLPVGDQMMQPFTIFVIEIGDGVVKICEKSAMRSIIRITPEVLHGTTHIAGKSNIDISMSYGNVGYGSVTYSGGTQMAKPTDVEIEEKRAIIAEAREQALQAKADIIRVKARNKAENIRKKADGKAKMAIAKGEARAAKNRRHHSDGDRT